MAAIYYNQPILGAIAAGLGVPPAAVGVLPMLTQLGYAAGIWLLAPLGDRFDRRRVILVKELVLVAALLAAGFAPSLAALGAACLAVGVAATSCRHFGARH